MNLNNIVLFSNQPQQKFQNLRAIVIDKQDQQVILQIDGKEIYATSEIDLKPGFLLELQFNKAEGGKTIYKLISAVNLIKDKETFLANNDLLLDEENLKILLLLNNNKIPQTLENFLFIKNNLSSISINKDIFGEILTSLILLKLGNNMELINFLKIPFQISAENILNNLKLLQLDKENNSPLMKYAENILGLENNLILENLQDVLSSFLNKDVLSNLLLLKQLTLKNSSAENKILNYFLSQQVNKEILQNFTNFIYFTFPLLFENKLLYVNWWMEKHKNKSEKGKNIFKISLKVKTLNLGIVEILFSLFGEEIFISFFLENENTRNIFKNNLNQLQQSVQNLGFKKIIFSTQKQNPKIYQPVDLSV